jgi:hypothetical protein
MRKDEEALVDAEGRIYPLLDESSKSASSACSAENPIVYLKNCCDCGKFVSKDRWTIEGAPRNPQPLCPTCWAEYDDPYFY